MASETDSGESLEKVLKDSYSFFGDLTDKVQESINQADRDYSSREKKEDIAEFYREKLGSFNKDNVDSAATEIRREAKKIAVQPKSIARFVLTEKLSKKATLLISRDQKLLKTVRTEEEKQGDLKDSSMIRKFIESEKSDVYNMKDQLTQYKSSVHGFEALRRLADEFNLDGESHEAAKDLKERAEERSYQVKEIRKLGDENPEKAVKELESLVNSFKEESQEISDRVNSLRRAEKD